MKCKNCNKTKNECSEKAVNQKPICNKCELCFICKQKENSSKLLMKLCCSACSEMCKKCKKILIKNNWPNDSIINKLCEKCSHLCEYCDKYTMDNKCIYRLNKRYCNKCFEYKFNPSNENEKFIAVTNKKKVGHSEFANVLIEWKKEKIRFQCTVCDRCDWKSLKNKSSKCQKCVKKISVSQSHTLDPSTKTEKYVLTNEIIDGIKSDKWVIEEKQYICSNCCTSIWIKKENFKQNKNGIYNCNKCKPIKINYKYKYDKGYQKWIHYSKKSRCIKCLKQKWVHVNSSNFGKKLCNMCIKLKN